ncbi:MAG: kelch repeat-containing protein, partial [Candidatus Acidiferrales bacterium]
MVVTVSGVASAGVNFTVYVTPSISSLSPTSGAVGTPVTITGTGFQASQGSSTLTFNGVTATPTNWNNTQIKALVPTGATTGSVVETVDGLDSNGVSFTVKPTPSITSASPMSGSAGVLVTIMGTNFGSSQGSSTVKFNGTSAAPSSWSASRIVVAVPSAATTGNLVVHTSGVDVGAGSFRIVGITSLAVSPANLTLPIYSVQRFTAVATNSDQTTEDISTSVSWTSSATSVGTIDPTGVLTSIAQGQTTVQATFSSFTGSTALTIQGRSFVPVATLIQARQENTATLLPNGTVLIAGGYGGYAGSGSYDTLSSAEIYDPTAKSVSSTNGWLSTPRQGHSATLLPNGKVLLASGETPMGGGYYDDTPTAELYDPSAGTFTPTGNLNTARDGHAAVLLPNGTVLIVGGYLFDEGDFNGTASAEIYDPSTGQFTPTGSLSVARGGCTATLLNSGKVLVAGGADGFSVWSTSEIYDPSTGQFSPGPDLPTPLYGQSATLLSNGTVMLAGGTTSWMSSAQQNVLIYDPTANTFSPIQSMAVARDSQTSTTLNDGTILILAGDLSYNNYSTAELFQPSSQTFVGAGATVNNLAGCSGCTSTPGIVLHTATLLNDGTVFVAGGNFADGTVELYEPGLRVPLSLQITPGSASMVDGGTQQFVVKDDLGNQRSDATWTISDSTIASLQSPTQPTVTAVKPGQVTLTADVDGVEAQAQISVAPVSLQVTPASATMLIGGTRQFTVVDERGRPSNIASWTVSDSSIATITSDSSPTLTADASGTVTLTATVMGVSAQGQATVSGLGSLASGTPLWSTPSTATYSPLQLAQAIPSDTGGPDLYSVGLSSDGTQSVVQALTIDGQQLWQTSLPALSKTSVPDPFGGLLGSESCTSTNPMTLVDLNAGTGTLSWQLPFPTVVNGQTVCLPDQPKMAVRQDGAVAVSMPLQISPRVFVLDGSSGSTIANPSIPASSITDQFGDVSTCDCYSPVGQPIVDSDGSIYVEYEVRQIPYPPTTISSTLSLLQIMQDGTTNTIQLTSSDNSNLFPGSIIPDGNGGVVASWAVVPSDGSVPTNPYQAAYVVSGAVNTAYNLPFTPANFVVGADGLPVNPSLALGDNGIAFVTDGTSSGDSTNLSLGPKIVSLNLNSGAVNWTYQVGTQTTLALIAAANGGGVAAKSTSGGVDTVLRFDSSGNVTSDNWTGSAIGNFGGDFWLGYSSTGAAGYDAAPIELSTSPYYGSDG